MATPILALAVFSLSVAHGWLWSSDQRRRAVQEAYNKILEEVRAERARAMSGT